MSEYGAPPPTPPPPYGSMPEGRPPGGAPPPNYLVWAILSTVCCCPPLGIPSIVFAAQVNSKWVAGDLAGAAESSRKARLWAIVAAAVGIPLTVIVYGFYGLLILRAEPGT